MARKKEWDKEKVIDAVKQLCRKKRKTINEITSGEIKQNGLYHCVVDQFGNLNNLRKYILDISGIASNFYASSLTALQQKRNSTAYTNAKITDTVKSRIKKSVDTEMLMIQLAEKKSKTIKKYLMMLLEDKKTTGKVPSLSRKYRVFHNIILDNIYVIHQIEHIISTTGIRKNDRIILFDIFEVIHDRYFHENSIYAEKIAKKETVTRTIRVVQL
jgi:hypothetical protein